MAEAALGLLGLGARSGRLVVGTGAVRVALKREQLALVVVASDSSRRTAEKVVRLARATGVPVVGGPRAAALGRQIGRHGAVQAVGVQDRSLAAGICGRLMKPEESLGE